MFTRLVVKHLKCAFTNVLLTLQMQRQKQSTVCKTSAFQLELMQKFVCSFKIIKKSTLSFTTGCFFVQGTGREGYSRPTVLGQRARGGELRPFWVQLQKERVPQCDGGKASSKRGARSSSSGAYAASNCSHAMVVRRGEVDAVLFRTRLVSRINRHSGANPMANNAMTKSAPGIDSGINVETAAPA